MSSKTAVLVLGTLTCLAALGLHARTLFQPALYSDDFDILRKSLTWTNARANLWVPVNEHAWPLFRLYTWLMIQAAGRLTLVPLAASIQAHLLVIAGMWLTYLFVRRERGDPFHGLVAMALFGVSAVYQEAVNWFAATPALPALDMTLLTLLAAQRWHQTGRARFLLLSALWAALAPAWYAGGILAGLLGSVYLLSPGGPVRAAAWVSRARWWSFLVPLLGSATFLCISLPRTAERILYADHYGSRNALEAFGVTKAFVYTGRSLVDNLALGSFGIGGVTCPPWVASAGLIVLTVVGIWWLRRSPARRLLIVGLCFILASDLLIYGARAAWSYNQLSHWSRYNVFPQLGLALVICAGLPCAPGTETARAQSTGLSGSQIRALSWLLLVLFTIQLPRGLVGAPASEPQQQDVLQMVEEMDARCRVNHIAADTARRVLDRLPMPGGGEGDNAWYLLRGSDDPRPISDAQARDLLAPR
jgi:hypothetical protein